MSTRCTLTVHDADGDSFTLYRHSDGYPEGEHGVPAGLVQAFPLAWALPRFEAMDFAAAIIAAWKTGGGNIYMTKGRDSHGDTEFHYDISWFGGAAPTVPNAAIRSYPASGGLMVLVSESGGWDSDEWIPLCRYTVTPKGAKKLALTKEQKAQRTQMLAKAAGMTQVDPEAPADPAAAVEAVAKAMLATIPANVVKAWAASLK